MVAVANTGFHDVAFFNDSMFTYSQDNHSEAAIVELDATTLEIRKFVTVGVWNDITTFTIDSHGTLYVAIRPFIDDPFVLLLEDHQSSNRSWPIPKVILYVAGLAVDEDSQLFYLLGSNGTGSPGVLVALDLK
jgi:hypothetical protein